MEGRNPYRDEQQRQCSVNFWPHSGAIFWVTLLATFWFIVPHSGFIGPQPGFIGPQPGFIGPQPGLIGPQPGLIGPHPGFTGPYPGFIEQQPGFIEQQPEEPLQRPRSGRNDSFIGSSPNISLVHSPQRSVNSGPPPRFVGQPRQQQGLTAARIANFEHYAADESLVGEQCLVCMKDLEVGTQMVRLDCQCTHYLCKNCAETWFKDHKSCPTCRQEFN